MSYHDDDLPSARFVVSNGIKYGLAFFAIIVVLGAVIFAWRLATAPARLAGGVVERVFNADHALQTYRWFHEANQQIVAKQGQIMLSKSALLAAAEDRKEARRIELLGLQQNCMNLVGEYNARAMRADTVIFQNPERFLPGNWPGERNPLPQSIAQSVCN